MSKIILQPCGNKDAREHYVDTIEKNVSLKLIKPYISPAEFKILSEIYPSGECKVWGVTPGVNSNNITKWNRIESGDVTLFSRSGIIYASAVTTFKIRNLALAAKLWDYDKKGQTWEYIYFLDEVKKHSIPYIDFNRAVGYADNYIIQGFNVLRPNQSKTVLKAFDLLSEIFIEEISEQEYEKIISKLESLEDTEADITSTRRLEQGYLKKILFGNKIIGTCACCKKDYPVSYLITAHIKKRAFCNLKEKKDSNVVLPMCKMGCDEIYEKGYISVSGGVFTDMVKTPTSPHLQNHIDLVAGTKCDYYSTKTKEYFDWHYNHFK